MKAAIVNKFGGYEALEYQDVPRLSRDRTMC